MKNRFLPSRSQLFSTFSILLLAFLVIPGNSALISGKTYTTSNFSIASFVADHNFLWVGTYGEGLIRIDKKTGETSLFITSNSGLPDNTINGLAVDTNGALIVGTSKAGVVRFNDTTWEKIQGVSENNVRSVCVDNRGSIWAWWQSSGIMRYTAGAWQPVINRFSGMFTSNPEGNIWIFKMASNPTVDCDDGWIQEYVNGGLNLTRMIGPQCSEIGYPNLMVVDNKKNCWFADSRGLTKSTDGSFKRFEINNDTNEFKSITALAADQNDVLLIAVSDYTKKTEIYLVDQKVSSELSFDTCTFSVDVKSITAACFDKETGDFWCASPDGKIVKIDQFKKLTVFKDGISVLSGNAVTSLIKDREDNIWISVRGGIARYGKDSKMSTFPQAGDTIPGRDVSSLTLDSSGNVCAGFQQSPYMSSVQSGVALFKSGHWSMIQTTHIPVKQVAFDKNNVLWLVTQIGVQRFSDDKVTTVFETKGSSAIHIALGTMVNTLIFDKNNIPWIGTGLGIKRYENSVWVDDTILKPFLPQTGSIPGGANIYCLHFDSDTLWVGTSQGLFKRFGSTCIHYDTTGAILPDMNVQCIATSAVHGVWAGTRRGLVQITGNKHVTYTIENTPLIDNDITACVVSSDGNIWAGTRLGGVTVLERSSVIEHIGTVDNLNDYTHSKTIQKRTIVSVKQQTNRMSIISIAAENSANVQLNLYTIQGKLMKSFHGESSGGDVVNFNWDGKDRFNHIVASGLYTGVVLVNGNQVGSVRIAR